MNTGGRKWRDVPEDFANLLRERLVFEGGIDAGLAVGPAEAWRIRYSDVTFTYYKKGTLFSTTSPTLDPVVEEMWEFIDGSSTPTLEPSSKAFLIGLDETGKGELVGHVTLVGAFVPQTVAAEAERLVSLADTKKKHSSAYWDEAFISLDALKDRGLEFIIEKVPPWVVDRYNLNRLLDVTYQRILNVFFRRAQPALCRIVVDDYGVGPTLDRFLRALEKQGAEIVVEAGADDKYLEARVASVLSKREREKVIEAINRKTDFLVEGMSVGSGNAGNTQTIQWLNAWKKTGQDWPWFIRRSFKTIYQLDGTTPPRKREPPIRADLLSADFREEFEEGRLSITSLQVVCPSCGDVSRAALVTLDQRGRTVPRCIGCKSVLPPDLGFTLRFYCGFVVPDANIIRRGLLAKDLSGTRFFDGFTVLVPEVVRIECDNRGGKAELARLSEFAAKSRIALDHVGEHTEELTSLERDDLVLEAAVERNAILITGDGNLRATAQARQIFTLSP
jgi:ribonuclease HII/rRNA-processing protein FCF1